MLVNVPGESTSVVTCLDGHPMAKSGRAGAALGIAAIGSLLAGSKGTLKLARQSYIAGQSIPKAAPSPYS